MTTKTFYVKIRGRVLGPFPPKRLMQMANQGQLSRVHQLSPDGNDWHRADKYPELFSQKPEAATEGQSTQQQPSSVASQPATIAEWHYGIDGSSDGPVTKSKIISMIKKESLAATDLLWHSEMPEWQPVESLPEFAAHLPQSVSIDAGGSGAKEAGSNRNAGIGDLDETARILKSQSPWVLFIFICLYIAAGFLFLGFLFGVIKGGQLNNNQLITQGVVSLLQMGVVIVAAVFLNRFAIHISHFHKSKNITELNHALSWLQRFWLLISIVFIIFIFLIVTAMVYYLSIN